MSESRGLAGHAAKPETRCRIIVGCLQPAVVEAESLARRILQVELAVIAVREMAVGQTLGFVRVQRAFTVKESARVGEDGHSTDIGVAMARATLPELNRRVGGPALEDEAPVAIAAFDKAEVRLHSQEYARMAEG